MRPTIWCRSRRFTLPGFCKNKIRNRRHVRAWQDRHGRIHQRRVAYDGANVRLCRAQERHLLVVGQLLRGKGLDLAIRSLEQLPPDCVLEVAGEGPSRGALERLAKRIAPDRVRFLGYLDGELPKLPTAFPIPESQFRET